MSMDIEKICRTCLALSGPFLSIFDGSSGGTGNGCVADMLTDFTKLRPKPTDKMPDKVCLACISEINHCYSFKMKCENSNKTLRQLLPDAVEEEVIDTMDSGELKKKVPMVHKGIQTQAEKQKKVANAHVQTLIQQSHQQVQTETRTNEIATSPLNKYIDESDPLVLAIDDPNNVQESDEAFGNDVETKSTTNSRSRTSKGISFKRLHIDSEENQIGEIVFELCSDAHDTSSIKDNEIENQSENGEAENTAYYVVSESLVKDENFTEPDYESDEYAQESMDNELPQSVTSENYSFTIINTPEGEEEIATSTTLTAPRRTRQSTTHIIKREELKCPNCLMTFVSIKNLKRHCLKMHGWSEDEINKLQPPPKEAHEHSSKLTTTQKMQTMLMQESQDEDQVASEYEQKYKNENLPTVDSNSRDMKPPKAVATGPNTVFCPRCNASFAFRKSLNYHMKQNQCTIETYSCPECQRVFTSKVGLEEHRETHALQHSCSECTMVFENKNELSTHMIEVHNRSAKNQCNICKKVFTMLSALKDHLRIHSGEKPFLCQTCGKSFRQNANLKQHVMRHSQVKPFKCELCPLGFVSKAELFSHKRTHTGDHPFKCEFCNARYTTSSSLVKHKRKHTGERPYACEFCPMRFSALNVLKNHRRTHTGEKPFTCMYCNKGFTQKSDCQIHQRTHTGEKRYSCHCGASFTHLSTMRIHQKLHQNDGVKRKRAKVEPVDKDDSELMTIEKSDETIQEGEEETLVENANHEEGEEFMQMAMNDMC